MKRNTIITISNLELGKFFFTTDHCQPHNLGDNWVSCTSYLPMHVVPRETLPNGIITNKEEYLLVFEKGIDGKKMIEIPNPQPEYRVKQELGPLQTKWIEALEQYPERQLKKALGKRQEDGSYKACCLGEAGLIAGVCVWKGNELYTIEGNDNSYLSGGGAYKAIGLIDGMGKRVDKFTGKLLAYMNDSGKTWSEIAAILRAEPEQYFTHSI